MEAPPISLLRITLKTKPSSKKSKEKHSLKRRNLHTLSYPKSSPSPLFISPTPLRLTREQALDHVLAELEASIDNGIKVDPSIFSSLLETCARMRSLSHGVRLHRIIPRSLLRRNAGVSSKLLRLYASCGFVDRAHRMFDEMPERNKSSFVWNSLLSGYAELGLYEDAMALYYQMVEDGVQPDDFTFPRVLKSCAGIGSIQHGEDVHRHAVRSGLGRDVFVLNALVDMYAKCGDIVKARKVFDVIPDRDSVSWNSMLTGYAHHGLAREAWDVCRGMLAAGLEPNSIAISTMLAKFSFNRKLGYEIHGWVLRQGMEWNLSIANALIAMYAEHKQLRCARIVFESMPEKDLVTWNTMISVHRKDCRAINIFKQMEDSGVQPDRVTFVSLLSSCANLGMVDSGRRLFNKMKKKYRIAPGMEHYGCMVNMLGRAGLVDEAYEMAKTMPFDGGPRVWGALLYACSVHGNVTIGEVAAERLFELEPDNEHNFELLMRIYRNAGRLEDVETVRMMMRERGLDTEFNL
ncbi:pentatricopeptide repeat-containing protein At4g25270, chloroplastic [Dioscorea cayenensis subsp. rotundata]|uniref:Pentatricopeptide repeat-containing protein At4g25270, chloroplastic n=1 Tax=Dioscorea cayennensis subsp. rotundata TaxID=55577 RepID=A0AB40B6H8_DIOCR|nr:pentatricopeptide repeat-containing protein At4g25270, chloroplastic [Dioscorea cayenensis subsp. rotundata]